jgi:hypothetical protein
MFSRWVRPYECIYRLLVGKYCHFIQVLAVDTVRLIAIFILPKRNAVLYIAFPLQEGSARRNELSPVDSLAVRKVDPFRSLDYTKRDLQVAHILVLSWCVKDKPVVFFCGAATAIYCNFFDLGRGGGAQVVCLVAIRPYGFYYTYFMVAIPITLLFEPASS